MCVCRDVRNSVQDDFRAALHFYRVRERSAAREHGGQLTDRLRVVYMPEYCLPYCVHLAAHHPSFPPYDALAAKGADVTALLRTLQQQLQFLLDSLMCEEPATSGADGRASSLPFLHAVLEVGVGPGPAVVHVSVCACVRVCVHVLVCVRVCA
jgi:hypothetical protein